MQSQQKKVKWSRGETADALEERTDTGITQVSASKMENIISDIYGNISRRPALKVISSDNNATDIPVISGSIPGETNFVRAPESFVFTIDEDTYIIFIRDTLINCFGGFLINQNKFIKKVEITNNTGWSLTYSQPISAAQYNNFMVVGNLYRNDVVLKLTETNDVVVEQFQFSAPWYAPGGTQSRTVSSNEITGLEFNHSGNGFDGYAYTDASGNSSPYYIVDTGLTGDPESIAEYIPVGSIVKFPKIGTYMRVEGYTMGSSRIYWIDYEFDSLLVNATTPSPTGYCAIAKDHNNSNPDRNIYIYYNGTKIDKMYVWAHTAQIWVRSSQSLTGFSRLKIQGHHGDYTFTWEDVTPDSLEVMMFGALLTPVADDTAKDSTVTVEYGYVSLNTYQPTKFAFSGQRLYAAGFYDTEDQNTQQYIPGYAVGSQIAKYNDFKNDYNTQAEAVVIDISTSYQEKITSIVDYNGLKILTDSAEYAYMNGGVVKQSENGSLESCQPIVFGSVCLYADKSGNQIRALEYEFSSNLFQSSSINQMAKEDLIFNTTSLAGVLDKEHYTGRFLYAPQNGYTRAADGRTGDPIARHALAVCNMVPGNQALIWSRWNMPEMIAPNSTYKRQTIQHVLEVNNKLWFVLGCYEKVNGYRYPGYTLAELDYDADMDLETTPEITDTEYKIIKNKIPQTLYAWETTVPNRYVYTYSETPVYGDVVYEIIYGEPIDSGMIVSSVVGVTLTYGPIDSPILTATYAPTKSISPRSATLIGGTVSVFDGDEYKWDDTLTEYGEYTQSLATLEHPRVGFMINATLESHPLDTQGKTYTEKKRIGKAVAVIRNTEPGAFTVCNKTGYTSPDKKTVNFYGCTGMKDQVRYTINNIQGAKFTIESLTMIIEYGTLES